MAAASPPRNPGVHYPPPLIYVAGFVSGWLVHCRWPLPIAGPGSRAGQIVAGLSFAIWIAFMLWAVINFRRARTSMLPNRPAARLVTSGPYRITRNPMYVSLVALYLAVSLLLNSWWPVLFLPLVISVMGFAVIRREEEYLAVAFPEEYAAYRRNVRRWL